MDRTPPRVKLIDAFMGFLVVVAALQFAYCLLVGNYVRIYSVQGEENYGRERYVGIGG